MQITWKINQLERQTSDGLVTTAHWTVVGVDGDFTASAYGSVGLERGDNFTAFDSLTEQQVLGWVQDVLGKDTVESSLAAQIEAQKNPVTSTGLPW